MTLPTHPLTGVLDEEGDLESNWCQFRSSLRLDREEPMDFAEVISTTGNARSEMQFSI